MIRYKLCFYKLYSLTYVGSALLIYAIRAHALHLEGSPFVGYMGLVLIPLANVALYGSIYVTLAVSIERFLGKKAMERQESSARKVAY